MDDVTLTESIRKVEKANSEAAIITAYKEIEDAVKKHEKVWVSIKVPETWVGYRLERNPDLLLFDPKTKTTWFPVYKEIQAPQNNIVSVPAGLDELVVYVADQDELSGMVINPYTNSIRIPKELVEYLANMAENHCE